MAGQRPAPTSRRADDRVVVIDDRSRKVFHFFISLFPNYRDAGRSIGVGKDTIAKYATESTNMAYPVYERMVEEILTRSSRKDIVEAFGRTGLDKFKVDVRSKNGGQIDNVMFEITPGIRALIQHYTATFPNRSAAARALELNPRTLKAYANGQIQAFPRSRFHKMIEVLKAAGENEKELLEMAGTLSWDEELNERSRSETLYLDREELLERMEEFLVRGELDLKKVSRPVYNACRRYFGSLGPACDAAMSHLADRTEKQIKAYLQDAEIEPAHDLVVELERAIRSYTRKVKARVHAARKDSKMDWRERVRALIARKERVKEAILKESQFHPGINAKNEHEKVLFTFPYLRDFRVYARERTFDPGELIFHPLFGMGRVLRQHDRGQMYVKFGPKIGTKILAFTPQRFV